MKLKLEGKRNWASSSFVVVSILIVLNALALYVIKKSQAESILPSTVMEPSYTPEQWEIIEDQTVLVLCEILETDRVGSWKYGRLDPKGQLLYTYTLERIVHAAYGAAPYNPRWGTVTVAGRRLLCAIACESWFYPEAHNVKLNLNKSADFGLLQINTMHLEGKPSTFEYWKAHTRLPFKPRGIYHIETNVYFGAWLNEKMMSEGNNSFKFYVAHRGDQVAVHDALFDALPKRLRKKGIELN